MPAPANRPDNPALAAALHYASCGLRVIPILPRTKRPPFDEWQNHATDNADTIRLWWRSNPRYGVGIATGAYGDRWLMCIDVDTGVAENGRIKEGDESLADLEAEHGELPTTMEGQSGSGGRHLWFWSPVPITNDQQGKLGVDLDIRGIGGQVVAAPTVHPDSGRPYGWIDGQGPGEHQPVEAPAWVIDTLTKVDDVGPKRAAIRLDDLGTRPGDVMAETWPDLLEADGASYIGRRLCRRTGHHYELWARPGVDHTSATLYYGGTDLLKVFTPNWPGLVQGETYTRFGYYAATRHGGDYRAAAAALRATQAAAVAADPFAGPGPVVEATRPVQPEDGDDGEDDGRNWKPADLAAALARGLTRPEPTILRRQDGKCLLYAGRLHTIFGPSGAGKTWVLYVAAAQLMAAGEHVVVLDWEDDENAYLGRMLALGLPAEIIVANSTYYPIGTAATIADLEQIDELIAERGTALVGIDSTGEALAAQGLDQDKDPDVARWMAILPRRWARLGPCVLMLDHMPHAGGREIGSQRKRAGINGAAYEAIDTETFARDKPGVLTLKVAKDRGGNYAKATEQAVVHFVPHDDGARMDVTVAAGSGRVVSSKAKSLNDYQEAVIEFLRQAGPSGMRAVRSGVEGDNSAIDMAVKALVAGKRIGLIDKRYALIEGVDK